MIKMMNAKLNALVHARWFERIILMVIVLAGVLAGLETSAPIVARHGVLLKWLDQLVLAIFILEMVLKIAVHGRRPWLYFRDGWNVFDFLIVLLCCLPAESGFAAVFRLTRSLRLLRLVTALPKLQLLVGALMKSLGAMGYVSLLLGLMFYIYGVAGVHLFGKADPLHFGSLATTLLSLFQVITLDNWSDIFRPAQAVAPLAATLYFVSFILLGTMIMLNLFIGIVMNSMSEMHAELERRDEANRGQSADDRALADDFAALERQVEALQMQATRLRKRLVPDPNNHRGQK